MQRSLYIAGALALSAGVLSAQQSAGSRDDRPVRVYSFSRWSDDRDRPAIGVTTSWGSMRDTLGLLVESVTPGGPADKAGIEEGNRLVAVNGVNLRLSASDAGENDMAGIANRRLIRELEKLKPGDEVELRVLAGNQTKTVKVKTVAFEDLPGRTRAVRRELDERPVLGLSLSATGSRRDTLGLLVVRVTTDGPAEKAGIVEGDRVQAINGVNLRVPPEDAGDQYMSSARLNRYRRELAKLTVGEDVELRVLSGGQTKSVRIKPVRAADLPRDRSGVIIIGDGAISVGGVFPALPAITIPQVAPRAPRIFEFDNDVGGRLRMRLDPRVEVELRDRAEAAARRARDASEEMLRRLDQLRWDFDRRGDAAGDAVEAPRPAPSRGRSSRIASTAGSGSGGSGQGFAYAADVRPVAQTGMSVTAVPAVASGASMAVWSGDDATFVLQGLRLARVNDDLAESLGVGSEGGFLILETGSRWSGLRSGDVLLEVDGHRVRDGATARITLGAGDEHTARVIRDGRERLVSVDVR